MGVISTTLIFGLFGMGMLLYVVSELPRISYLFLFGGLCFSLVFLVGMWILVYKLENGYIELKGFHPKEIRY